MHIQVNHNQSIEGSERLNSHITEFLTDDFSRFSNLITRIEVHVSDENGEKTGAGMDKKCLLVARIANRSPVVVSGLGDTVHEALDSAAEKLRKSLDQVTDRMNERTGIDLDSHLTETSAEI